MYQVGKRRQSKRKLYAVILIVGLLVCSVVLAGVLVANRVFKSDTVMIQGQPTTTHVDVGTPNGQSVDEAVFNMKLPLGWEMTGRPGSNQEFYSWRGTDTEDKSRSLELYLDKSVGTFAVNRLLSVTGESDHMSVGSVSDNCVNFTGKTTESSFGGVPAKWGGVNFLCDLANYNRNVVGIGSPDGLNTVELTGQQGGRHSVFFTYTDNSSNPDYSVLIDALRSFRIK